MKKKINFSIILTSLICLIPFVMSALFYKELPDTIATHWNFNGVPDGYSSKAVAAFGIPTFLFIINLITNFAIDKDPNKVNNTKVLIFIGKWMVPIVSVFVHTYIISYTLGKSLISISTYVMIFQGLLTMVIGNYLPKCQPNNTIGIKTPWAIKDKENWKKTHRISGFIWVIGGFVLCINAFMNIGWINVAVIIGIILVPCSYSYIIYKNK